jgi:hypothetical protein
VIFHDLTKSFGFSQIAPHCEMTASTVSREDVVLSVGDTTYLDYRKILAKQDGYGPQGKGGKGQWH